MELKLHKYLIIHHTATARDKTTFEAVRNYHIRKGWGDIAYHYFISGDGRLYRGREENVVGAHCRANGMNFKSLGICLTGNFEQEHPSEAQLKTLEELIEKLRAKYNIPIDNVLGHKEVPGARTVCPGRNFLEWLIAYRERKKKEKIEDEKFFLSRIITLLEELIKYLKMKYGEEKERV